MIELKGLTKKYKEHVALDVPMLKIEKGQSFGLVGNNGAGKTTMFRLILDLIPATEGEVLSGGTKVSRSEHWKSYTGSYIDEGFLIDFLTPKEYLTFVGGLHGIGSEGVLEFIHSYDGLVNPDEVLKPKLIRDLSKGNKAKVGLLASFLGNPELIILDEPFVHLDPSSQIRLKEALKDLNATRGTTLIISSHDLKHVTEVCQRIVLLEEGKVKEDIRTEESTLSALEEYFS